ncbi:hypothetical protein ACWD7M_16795 [Streptomyces griseus]
MSAISLQITPTCCPDVYLCGDEYECPRHGGFTVCCDRTEAHVPQDRDGWHRLMWEHEQELLNALVRGNPIEAVIGAQAEAVTFSVRAAPVFLPVPLEYITIAFADPA